MPTQRKMACLRRYNSGIVSKVDYRYLKRLAKRDKYLRIANIQSLNTFGIDLSSALKEIVTAIIK